MVKRNVKTILALFMVFILTAAMVGCAGSSSGTEGNSDTRLSEQPEENSEDEKDTSGNNEESDTETLADNGKILVAYFSHSGNTKKLPRESKAKREPNFLKLRQ